MYAPAIAPTHSKAMFEHSVPVFRQDFIFLVATEALC
jgi:hypothetical protein